MEVVALDDLNAPPPITLTMPDDDTRDIVHTHTSAFELTQCIHKLLSELFSWSVKRLRR